MKAFLAAALLLPLAAASSVSKGGSVSFPVVQHDVQFNSGVDTIRSSQVADLLSALNGYSVSGGSDNWRGLRSYNPIRHPRLFLVADFELGGQDGQELTMNSNLRFRLDNDQALDQEFAALKARSLARWPEAEGRMKFVATTNEDETTTDDAEQEQRVREAASLLQQGDQQLFEIDQPADRAFLLEYKTFKDVIAEVDERAAGGDEKTNEPSTVYWLRLGSLRRLAAAYSPGHKKTQQAVKYFSKLVGTASGVLEAHRRALFMVIQESGSPPAETLSRTRRETTIIVKDPNAVPEWNLAHQYDGEYHVVFAITAFTMLILVLGVLATSVGLWFMDPGRDSIIYRMTSQRIKMD